MSLSKKKIQSSLKKKGFEEDKSRSHIVYEYQTLDGNESGISTHMSHGSKSKNLSKQLCAKMAKQCKLTKNNFARFVDCSMDQNEYEENVKKHFK